MDIPVDKYLNQLENKIIELSRFTYIVRGTEVQKNALQTLSDTLNHTKITKEYFIEQQNEHIANTLLSYEILLDCLAKDIRVGLYIKNGEPSSAWNELVLAQKGLEALKRINFLKRDYINDFQYRLYYLEKTLFPEQTFMSVGFITEDSECSICGELYDNCEHIKGLAYMGNLCFEIMKKCKELQEVSVVDIPADKRCRVLSVTHEGKSLDVMTLEEINNLPT